MNDKSPTNKEIEKLRDTIQLMDNFSQHGFSQIAAIARLTLISMKTPETRRTFDDIAYALELICEKAEHIEDCINGEAESAGCNYINEEERARWAAHREVNNG